MNFSIVFWLHHGQFCAIVPLQIMRLVEKIERSCLQSLTEAKNSQAITKSALEASSASELLPLPVPQGICRLRQNRGGDDAGQARKPNAMQDRTTTH